MIFDLGMEDVPVLGSGYGFVESFSKPSDATPYSRVNVVLDAVDADAFDTGETSDRSQQHLSMVRIMSTLNRLESVFNIGTPIVEGDWFYFRLGVCPGMPRAWQLEADGDYSRGIIAMNLISFFRIGVGGNITKNTTEGKLAELRAWCKVRGRAAAALMNVRVPPSLHVRVADVGHANFAAIHVSRDSGSKIIGYFDVGGPMFFHHLTFPKKFADPSRIPSTGFVALSHWDFDHYSLAVTKMKALQKLTWYAPDQPVGPNAARLQTLLAGRLNFVNTPTFRISGSLEMWQGTGATTDRNNSGYVLTVRNFSGTVLLTGDVAYDHIPLAATANLVALGVTHHGGSGAGTPPTPSSGHGAAAVSFGLPNRYHYPNWNDIATHSSVGWTVIPTFFSSTDRGDVWLP